MKIRSLQARFCAPWCMLIAVCRLRSVGPVRWARAGSAPAKRKFVRPAGGAAFIVQLMREHSTSITYTSIITSGVFEWKLWKFIRIVGNGGTKSEGRAKCLRSKDHAEAQGTPASAEGRDRQRPLPTAAGATTSERRKWREVSALGGCAWLQRVSRSS